MEEMYQLHSSISMLKDCEEKPTLREQSFNAEDRHVIIHTVRAWLRRELSNLGVEVDIRPNVIEAATAGTNYHEWFYDDQMTVKVRVWRTQ